MISEPLNMNGKARAWILLGGPMLRVECKSVSSLPCSVLESRSQLTHT
jgi:hypothetical protein